MQYAHLHVHSQYSVLDGQSKISELIETAVKNGQPALALTDHGNMFGVKEFIDMVAKMKAPLKPIIGSEMYVAKESCKIKKGKEDQSSFHLILLAKNMQGYHNLIKLSSISYVDGFYYKPRIDHELLEQYHEGLICSSGCIGGEVPQAILHNDIEGAEKIAQWYKSIFGDDYYLEVQRHKTDVPGLDNSIFEKQEKANREIFKIADKLGIKVIATNDVHFVRKDDGPVHDRLICISTASEFDDPKRLRYTQQEYLKSTEEMRELFADHPEVISNTMDIVDKVEVLNLNHDPILPLFPLPEPFTDSNEYLRHLTYRGANDKYGENIDAKIKERIDFELGTIKNMGFPDYFLIVQDLIAAARKMGVWVGPGRGSAAGSVVAYCLGITNIDPIKYNLLFERFLNPDRISMPDIDIDFDDEGRSRVFKYVEEKYGKYHVSHVITFGTMATKSVIRDVGRLQKVSLEETNHLAKLVPKKITIEKTEEQDDPKHPGEKIVVKVSKDVEPTIALCMEKVPEFIEEVKKGDEMVKDTIKYAERIEGTVRNTGVHACATIIGRDDLTNFIPLSTAKDKDTGQDILVSQFEGSLIESAGMLKMDFLGLKTLTILKDCIHNIKQSKNIDIDINAIPLDDALTFDLFSRGDTVGVFQFESEGMQKWLTELKPSRFDDLIAMNALYRPGPMNYIPDFVERKQGRKKIEYDLPEMEEILRDTYGVTVYQEQVMLLSQKLANFTKGKADKLRKAMGKKKIAEMEALKDEFFKGGEANGYSKEILSKIWNDWQSFAQYAFNKSHATCYALIGYHTGYLKAHYRAEYMAAVLSNNLNDIDKISKFMDDCRKSGIKILGPDVNESYSQFTVNKEGNIRFGMAGIKGIGVNAVSSIISSRNMSGPFTDIFNFVERINTTVINKKGMEALLYSGAFDSFEEINRNSFAIDAGKGETFLDLLLKYSNTYQKNMESMKSSLFGVNNNFAIARPPIPVPGTLNQLELLQKEKELVGMYISAHPLDKFRFEIENLTDKDLISWAEYVDLADMKRSEEFYNKEFMISGLVTGVDVRNRSNGKGILCKFTIEDFKGSRIFTLFDKDYEHFMGFIQPNRALLLKVCTYPKMRRDKSNPQAPLEIFGTGERIKAIYLLDLVREEMIKEIVINLPVDKVDEPFRKELKKLISRSKGKTLLTLNVMDEANHLNAEFISKKYPIIISDDLLNFLDRNKLTYRLSKVI